MTSDAQAAAAPVVIEVRDLGKSFRVPDKRADTIRERVSHPLAHRSHRSLEALSEISFDVHDGEFFGIVGRNGSGKSTLLKILSSIYRADTGRVRMAGRVAPFIELGVGFNPELSSRENVVLNGVILGLSRREARLRLDSVLDFAELRDFADLKLKNYSSGMLVRLAFSVMVEADADVMLIDEVLAVGDAAFAQKCNDVFAAKRRAGKTVVLVTHDMASVQSLCDRAMLLHGGELRYIGDPEETALRYYRLNFGGEHGEAGPAAVPDVNVSVVEAHLEDAAGERADNVEQGQPIRLNALLEARHDLERPAFGFHVVNDHDIDVFAFNQSLEGEDALLPAGQRVRITATVENPLLPGRYKLACFVARHRDASSIALQRMLLLDFTVYGTRPAAGMVAVEAETEVRLEAGP